MTPASYSPMRLELLRQIWPVVTMWIVCSGVTWISGRWLLTRFMRLRRIRLNELGTTELEFALAFPVFLVSVLITVQVALMVNAALVVDYSAFCAARSAAVWVPQGGSTESPNTIAEPQLRNSEKGKRIRAAASIACVPISPRLSGFAFGFLPQPPSRIRPWSLQQLASLLVDPGSDVPIDLSRLSLDAVDKWLYSELYTDVVLLDRSGEAPTDFPADSNITARVTHKFYMNVPFGGQILGAAFGDRFNWFFGQYYVPISASYTLMLAHG